MNDYIISASAENGTFRVFGAYTKSLCEQSRKIHETSPVVTAALGRMLTATLLMSTMNKNNNKLTVQIKSDGPLKGMLTTSEERGTVKGYPLVNIVDIPLKPNGKLDVSGAVGKGILSVTKDMGLKEPYNGQIPLYTSEIAEDFAYYFIKSEQTPSAVALGVLVDRDYSVKQSGGIIIQRMPGASDATSDIINQRISNMEAITTQLDKGLMPEDILKEIFSGMEIHFNEKLEALYKCNCSRDRMRDALCAIGKDEITDILENEKEADLHCHFCNSHYCFDENDLKTILNR